MNQSSNSIKTSDRQKKVAIVQSNYIPWKGYFDLINSVDEFVLYDDMQYTKRDWRNRNTIKTPHGGEWLTIPVEVKGKFHQPIRETRISDSGWARKHLASIRHNYSKAGYFQMYYPFLEELYLNPIPEYLSEVNQLFITAICKLLNIPTVISRSTDYRLCDGKSERLLDLCKQTGSAIYLSGPKAKGYLDESLFTEEKIEVEWFSYSGYPEYNQLFPPFEHGVTILDLILNEGPRAQSFMKSFGEQSHGSSIQ